MANYLEVGKIVNTHGIRGEVRVQSATDSPAERYAKGSELFVELSNNEYVPVVVNSHRVHKTFDLLTFEGYPNMNDVLQFKTKLLMVDEKSLPELEDNEYYANKLIGSKVMDESGQFIGELTDILFLPANDVWVVKRQGLKDLLLPNIESVIRNVNIDEQEITVHVLEGLDPDEN